MREWLEQHFGEFLVFLAGVGTAIGTLVKSGILFRIGGAIINVRDTLRNGRVARREELATAREKLVGEREDAAADRDDVGTQKLFGHFSDELERLAGVVKTQQAEINELRRRNDECNARCEALERENRLLQDQCRNCPARQDGPI